MSKEAMKLALETSEGIVNADWRKWDELASPSEFERWAKSRANFMATILREALAEQPAQPQQEPVAWRDHVEQRLLTWRQSFVNKSGDQLALDDFMDKRSLDDLIDFVCSEYTPPPAQRTWVGLTDEEIDQGLLRSDYAFKTAEAWRAGVVFAMTKLKEKNT